MTHPSQEGAPAKFWVLSCVEDYAEHGGHPGQCKQRLTAVCKNEDVALAQLTHLADLCGWEFSPRDPGYARCAYHNPANGYDGQEYLPAPLVTNTQETQ